MGVGGSERWLRLPWGITLCVSVVLALCVVVKKMMCACGEQSESHRQRERQREGVEKELEA